MENLQLTYMPQSKTGMLIRKPVTEVFTAFVDPAVTTKFWFTKAVAGWRWDRGFNGIGKCTASRSL